MGTKSFWSTVDSFLLHLMQRSTSVNMNLFVYHMDMLVGIHQSQKLYHPTLTKGRPNLCFHTWIKGLAPPKATIRLGTAIPWFSVEQYSCSGHIPTFSIIFIVCSVLSIMSPLGIQALYGNIFYLRKMLFTYLRKSTNCHISSIKQDMDSIMAVLRIWNKGTASKWKRTWRKISRFLDHLALPSYFRKR